MKASITALLLFAFSINAQARIGHDTPVVPEPTVAEVIEKAIQQEYPNRPLQLESVIPGGIYAYDWMNKYIDLPLSKLTSRHQAYKIKAALPGCQESSALAQATVFFMHGYDRKSDSIDEVKNDCIYTVAIYGTRIVSYLTDHPGAIGTKDIVVNICH